MSTLTVEFPTADHDDAIAEVESRMSVLFTRARLVWKESAAQVHPELQPSGYKLLAIIARLGRANAHQLGELLEMDKSVVSRQVRVLEELGLVESRPDERDGRARVLTATPPALAGLEQVRSHNLARLRSALGDFDPQELDVCARVFRRIAEA